MPDCKAIGPHYGPPDPRQHFLAQVLRRHPIHRLPCQFCGQIIDARDRDLDQHGPRCELARAIRVGRSK